jgi:hypothetical protein
MVLTGIVSEEIFSSLLDTEEGRKLQPNRRKLTVIITEEFSLSINKNRILFENIKDNTKLTDKFWKGDFLKNNLRFVE